MLEIADLRDCPPSGLFYGGRAGRKEGILVDGEPWIAKYPRAASSPVGEYLGAHVYSLLGIPAHETMLGYRGGRVVCACRDFTFPTGRLFEFRDIKNALSDDEEGFVSPPSDGDSVFLGDVLAAIGASDPLRSVPGVLERFWDMFVVDAFVGNPDRNNASWGLLMGPAGRYSLAPVYGLGSCLSGKGDALAASVSCYRVDDGTPRGAAVRPFEYMAASPDPDLRAAVERFARAIDMGAVERLIDSVPEEAYGRVLMAPTAREAHKALLRARLERGVLPILG